MFDQARDPNHSRSLPTFWGFQEPGKAAMLPERFDLYQPGWNEADKATVRAARGDVINRWLALPKKAGGKYQLTPASKEKAF